MQKEPDEGGGGKHRPTKSQSVPLETVALAFAVGSLVNDQEATDRASRLALRGPEPLRQWARALLQMQGRDVDQLMAGEPDTPATRAEVLAFVEPMLKKGAALAGLTQLTGSYLLDESSTPEEIIFVGYIFLRLAIVGEKREPSAEESKKIWAWVIAVARHAKIVEPRWQELAEQGQVYLDSWLEETKERARKKFQTFIRRKQRIEANAEKGGFLDFV
jgi:hypothetical protein